jgi:putative Mg2+ transporter-C (MgtC) family protein
VDELKQEIFVGLGDGGHLVRVVVRLLVAAVIGGVVGFEREREGKAAGIRTHALVSLGGALLTLACLEAGFKSADLSRVIQGLITGIGFLGGGTILKMNDEKHIRGLTTAASIWMTMSLGVTVALGMLWPALLGTALAWVILRLMHRVEDWARPPDQPPGTEGP